MKKEIIVGIVVATATALITFASIGIYKVITHDSQIQHLQVQVEKLSEQVDSLEVAAGHVPGLMRKWNNCRQKEVATGKKHVFYWDTLECISDPQDPSGADPKAGAAQKN